jgi:superfamily II DNA or RNA helicase
MNAPQYRRKFKQVWLWNDWLERWGADKGIDLVALTKNDELWAIQAKAVHRDRSIPKSELDSFLSESNRPQFDYRLIIATTDDIGRNARDTIAGQEKSVGLVLRGDLLSADLRWPIRIGEEPQPLPRKKPRPHQAAAIRQVVRGFRRHKRGRLIMACGSGKTLTALWIAEKLASRRTLVLVPSLSLIGQTLSEWGRNSAKAFDYLVVCSDATVVERHQDARVTSTSDLGVPVTTDAKAIRQFLNRKRGNPAVVFCTYQSSDCIAAAQQGGRGLRPRPQAPPFDLVLADEAHRCTGHAGSLFTTVLDAAKIKARKRLFMTATPRYFTERVKQRAAELEYELASMDDEARFGPVFHCLTFAEAIDQDLLTDYQVVIFGVTQAELAGQPFQADIRQMAEDARLVRTRDGLETDARTLAAQVGLAKAMREHDLRKIITFHSSVAKARRFTDRAAPDSLPAVIERMSEKAKPSGQLWPEHISGHTPAGRRLTLLQNFGSLANGTRGILSNCACLGEGVDVPVLDSVAFIDPKRSMIDIIQAVGRVIRKAPDKCIGTVVIPVFVDESEDADHALSNSAFEPVWQVLKALRAHDERLADELDELRLRLGKRSPYGGKIRLPAKIKVDVPTLLLKDFEQAFYVRTVEKTTRPPPLTEKQILQWLDAHHSNRNEWPNRDSGAIEAAPGETWFNINQAMRLGLRGLPGGTSLARLLAERRGVRKNADLTGKRFGKLTVTKLTESRRGRFWKCKCDCGRTSVVSTPHLVSGATKSCGCMQFTGPKAQDLTGRRFGRLVAQKLLEKKSKHGALFWECKCDCGKQTRVLAGSLTGGHTKSCGCLHPFFPGKRKIPKSPEVREDADGVKWYSPPLTARKFKVDVSTLYGSGANGKRQGWKNSCPYNCGKGIPQMEFEVGPLGRTAEYFHGPTVEQIVKAQALAQPIPSYPGLVHIDDALSILGYSPMTLLRRMNARQETILKKSGNDKRGLPCRRAYVPLSFVKAEQNGEPNKVESNGENQED